MVLAALWAVVTYDGLIRRENIAAETWNSINAQLKYRADIIPNIAETIRDYASHERTSFDELERLGSTADTQDVILRAQAETAISAAIGRVMALAESYPTRAASQNFRQLETDLANIEDQIQLARRYYNGAVRELNVSVAQFPSNLVANIGGLKPVSFFHIDTAAERVSPNVSFA